MWRRRPGLEKPEKYLLADCFWSKMPASLENFASAASFSERGTHIVPSARSADSRGLGAQPPAGSRGSAPCWG